MVPAKIDGLSVLKAAISGDSLDNAQKVGVLKAASELSEPLANIEDENDLVTIKTIVYRLTGSETKYSVNLQTETPGLALATMLAKVDGQPVSFRLVSVTANKWQKS